MSEETKEPGMVDIAIVGAGGIGSNLVHALVPALSAGALGESLGGVRITIHDSDRVDEDNLAHQRFLPTDVGEAKAGALCRALSPFAGQGLVVRPLISDVRKPDDIEGYDIVVVAVDSPIARRAVHQSSSRWLDLRCLGDGYVALDDGVDATTVNGLTGEHPPMSCQFEGAIASGNIQFGYMIAAAHGAQWVIQTLRAMGGANAMTPHPQSASITFGTLGRMGATGGEGR